MNLFEGMPQMPLLARTNLIATLFFLQLIHYHQVILVLPVTCQEHGLDYQQQQQPQPQPQEPSRQPVADPEYIKREIKDLVVRRVDEDGDRQVSYEELKNYLIKLHEENIEHHVEKQWRMYQPQIHEVFSWEGYEPEEREVLTWDSYFNQTYPELIGVNIAGIPVLREQETVSILNPSSTTTTESPSPEANSSSQTLPPVDGTDKKKEGAQAKEEEDSSEMKALKTMARRADVRWKLADDNGDTLLVKSEFKYLLYPDEGTEMMQAAFANEVAEDMDLDGDGKINLAEFMGHVQQQLAGDEERDSEAWLASQRENFARILDKNKDGLLDMGEIKDWIHPKGNEKFEADAKRLLELADANDDKMLSNGEIMEHYEAFSSLLPAEHWRDSNDLELVAEESLMGDQGTTHDEL